MLKFHLILGLLFSAQATSPTPTGPMQVTSTDPKVAAFAAALTKAEAGDAHSEFVVGSNFELGEGVAKDPARALLWLQEAAKQNDAEAFGGIGWAYANGYGVAKDLDKAYALYLRGAQAGNAQCQALLAECYAKGVGTKRDMVSSLTWYKEAAIQGDADAQLFMGTAYFEGRVVPKDYKVAFTYFLNAANCDCSAAQYDLGIFYNDGLFVPRDCVQAYKWFKIAEATNHDPEVVRALAALSKTLTPEQMSKGEELAGSWQKDQSLGQAAMTFQFLTGNRTRFPMEYKDGHLYIKVNVLGHPALRFMLDTGATTLLSDDLAAKFHIDGDEFLPQSGFGPDFLLGKVATNVSLALPGLDLEHVKVKLAPLGVFKNSALTGDQTMDGVFGIDLLQHFVVRIDYINQTVEFIDPADFKAVPADTVLAMNVGPDLVTIEAQMSNNGATSNPLALEIDTGACDALSLARRTADALPQLNLNAGQKIQVFGLSGLSEEKESSISSLQIGSLTCLGPTTDVSQDNEGVWVGGLFGLIGNDIWHRFDMTLDFPDRKLYLKKNALFDEPYAGSKTGLSVSLAADLKTLSVLDVAPGSPAATAGFHRDDVLMKIDGIELKSLAPDEAATRFRSPGRHVIVVSRTGQLVELFLLMGPIASTKASASP